MNPFNDRQSALHVVVYGEPVGKGRPRLGRFSVYTPKATRVWEAHAVALIRGAHLSVVPGPVFVSVHAVSCKPKSNVRRPWRLWRVGKPDIDNVAKIALDSLVRAGVINDDTQVVALYSESLQAAENERPSVSIELWTATECPS